MTPPPDYAEVVARAEASREKLSRISMPVTAVATAIEASVCIRDMLAIIRQQREALELCEKYDTTIQYQYGQVDRRGVKPPAGKRWKTPREIARDTLAARKENE